jgi:YD repeat-containing protein
VINAVVGSGYPKCKLVKNPVGDFDGKIYNVDGVLLVDPVGLTQEGGRYYQERWVQETDRDGWPIQLAYDEWDKTPKTHRENGCVIDSKANPGLPQPAFCSQEKQGFQNYKEKHPLHKMVSLSVAAISLAVLTAFWASKYSK